ncbi:MAG: glycosyltransferase family 4 protein [Herpetosiphonaceae bacterium]|nr:glycosyltransferase family 4 protein [Herpetosiphonaceae bacterium]
MRIVHYNLTTTAKEGGVETFVWELSQLQVRRGHQVTIIGGAGHVERAISGVQVLRYPFIDRMIWRRMRPLRRHFELTKLLERLSMMPTALPALLQARPAIVHLHKPYDFVIAPLAHAVGAKVVYHGHGEDFYPSDRWLVRGVDAILSCSGYNAETLIQHYGRVPTVVFNGFDPAHFAPQPPNLALRAQWARPDEPVALWVGRLQPWKGIQYAIEALALVPPERKLQLLIAGEGTYRASLEALIHRLQLQDRVHLLDALPHREVRRYFAIADMVLGTSFASETFGMVLCEALACARPVISSDWAGFREVVLDGVTGWVVPRQQPAALAAAMLVVLDHPIEAARRAEQGRARVNQLFTWAAVTGRVEAVYERLLARRDTQSVV